MGLADVPRRAAGLGSIVAAVGAGSLLHPLVTGQTGTQTIGGLTYHLGGNLVGPSVVLALVSLGLAIVWTGGISDVSVDVRGSVVPIALAGLIVATAVMGSTGPAAAQDSGLQAIDDCAAKSAETAINGLVALEGGFGAAASTAQSSYETYQQCRRVSAENTAITEVDNFATAESVYNSRINYHKTTQETLDNSRQVVWGEVVSATIDARKNGLNESQAKEEIESEVDKYYSNRLESVYRESNSRLRSVYYIDNSSGQIVTVSSSLNNGELGQIDVEIKEFNKTLPNGENVTVVLPKNDNGNYRPDEFEYEGFYIVDPNSSASEQSLSSISPYNESVLQLWGYATEAPAPNDNYRSEVTIGELKSQHTDIETQAKSFVGDVYQQNISTQELASNSPIAVGQAGAQNFSQTGAVQYKNLQLAASGLSGSQNVTHKIRLEESGDVIEGSLFYTENNTTVSTGQTINPSTYPGTWIMSVATWEDENGTQYQETPNITVLRQNFTVISMTDGEGNSINQTDYPSRDFEPASPDRLSNSSKELQDLRDRLSSIKSTIGVGGSGGSGGSGAGSGNGGGIPGLNAIAAALGISTGLTLLVLIGGLLLALRVAS